MKKQYLALFREAEKAGKNAYCPYSKFGVGAAALAGSGVVYTGANVENASYGLTCCAERTAVFTAIAAGERKVKAVAIAGPGRRAAAPCGACRQVICEFGEGADIITRERGRLRVVKLSKLLPESFSRKSLGK